MRTVRFVTATQANATEFKERPIFKSLRGKHDLYARLENKNGLPKVYNLFLDGKLNEFTHSGPNPGKLNSDDIIVFVHDDVEIFGNNVDDELNHWTDEGFSVMGLAGSAKYRINPPTLWHLMTDQGNHSGTSVFHNVHRVSPGKYEVNPDYPRATTFGPLKEVELLDGVLIAVTKDAIEKTGLRFDEDFTFHHYDLSFSILARRAGLKMRTVFIPILHASPGLLNMEEPAFLRSQVTFLRKYKAPLS